ncbi:unnamed protein product [Aphanomyces euteiches]|nr:hypothetical protein Ae201684P_019028 [Aphanomyces euteiches]
MAPLLPCHITQCARYAKQFGYCLVHFRELSEAGQKRPQTLSTRSCVPQEPMIVPTTRRQGAGYGRDKRDQVNRMATLKTRIILRERLRQRHEPYNTNVSSISI